MYDYLITSLHKKFNKLTYEIYGCCTGDLKNECISLWRIIKSNNGVMNSAIVVAETLKFCIYICGDF